MQRLLVLLALPLIIGCGLNPPPVAEAVSVNGKVVSSDGKPVGNVAVNLQPLENGYAKSVDVKADGTFTVETQAGKYAYFFSPKTGSKTVPPQVAKLTEASMERTVAVNAGQEIVIGLQ